MKTTCIVSCPIDTYSGYGARSRDFVDALIKSRPDWHIKILSQRWGNTRKGYLKDHNRMDLYDRIITNISVKPNVWFQITVPNEFQPVGDLSIGLTAGIETTICDPSWLEGVNRMDAVFVSSNHSMNVFKSTNFHVKQPETNQTIKTLSLSKPVEVLFEGLDLQTYFYKESNNKDIDLSSIKESFCFLCTGHWMQGDLGHDRKNIGYTVVSFLETFKNTKNPPALILKTQKDGTSHLDREEILDKINAIRSTVSGNLPNIYLFHGEVSDKEMNDLYNHPKVKALVSFTKGEGFGRPLMEFTQSKKPVIASGWSGQTDFLNSEFSIMVGGEMETVHPSAHVPNIILKEASWFKPNDSQVNKAYLEVYKNYKKHQELAKRQAYRIKTDFSTEKMQALLDTLLTKYENTKPRQVQISLPKLDLPKLELPKLKKI